MNRPDEISVTYKLTRNLSLDFDQVVTDVNIEGIQNRQIVSLPTVDFKYGNTQQLQLSNYAVNNITLSNGSSIYISGRPVSTVYFKLPLSSENKSRNFYMRIEKPTDCNYIFVETDGKTRVNVESNIDLDYMFDNYFHKRSLSTIIFEVVELKQNPTTIYVGSQNNMKATTDFRRTAK